MLGRMARPTHKRQILQEPSCPAASDFSILLLLRHELLISNQLNTPGYGMLRFELVAAATARTTCTFLCGIVSGE